MPAGFGGRVTSALKVADMCGTSTHTFRDRPSFGSPNYAGIITLQDVPKGVNNNNYTATQRNLCECQLVSAIGGLFDVMIKSRETHVDEMCDVNCRDRLEINYIKANGMPTLYIPVLR